MRKKRAASREGMVVTSVALEKALHRRLMIAALDDNLALTEIVRQAVRDWLERRGGTRSTRRGA